MDDFACSMDSAAFVDVRELVEVMSLVLGIKQPMEFERHGPDCCVQTGNDCVLHDKHHKWTSVGWG